MAHYRVQASSLAWAQAGLVEAGADSSSLPKCAYETVTERPVAGVGLTESRVLGLEHEMGLASVVEVVVDHTMAVVPCAAYVVNTIVKRLQEVPGESAVDDIEAAVEEVEVVNNVDRIEAGDIVVGMGCASEERGHYIAVEGDDKRDTERGKLAGDADR